MATEDGLKETEKGVQLAHQSGDANEDIIQMVERTAQLASAISLATQQQRTASEQVVATMREIAQLTRQTAGGSKQAWEAANHLGDIAQEMRTAAQNFRIDEDADNEPPEPGPTPPLRLAASSVPTTAGG
jgi:methyl-accepting chemotaxis protein